MSSGAPGSPLCIGEVAQDESTYSFKNSSNGLAIWSGPRRQRTRGQETKLSGVKAGDEHM